MWNWLFCSSVSVCLYVASHLYCYYKKHKHFSLTCVMEAWRSLIQSVKLVLVVSVSFHNQQCDNFCKIQHENANGTGAIIYIWCFIAFFPLQPSLKAYYYTSLRARGTCPLRSGWCLDLLTWPTLKNLPLFRSTWRRQTALHLTSGCRAVHLQMCHPWFVFKSSFSSELLSLGAPDSCLSLSPPRSDI